MLEFPSRIRSWDKALEAAGLEPDEIRLRSRRFGLLQLSNSDWAQQTVDSSCISSQKH